MLQLVAYFTQKSKFIAVISGPFLGKPRDSTKIGSVLVEGLFNYTFLNASTPSYIRLASREQESAFDL